MKTLKIILIIISLFISLPIGIYIRYYLLTQVHADRLMMFLFWVDIPFSLLMTIIAKVIEVGNKK